MSTVLIDNWNLVNANLLEKENGREINESYANLLSSIVLWDDVYFLDDGLATFSWRNTAKEDILKPVLKPLYLGEEIRSIFENKSLEIYEKNHKEQKKIVAQRAILYHEICKAYGYDYFPIKERADFMVKALPQYELWSRNAVLKKEEETLLKKLQEFEYSKKAYMKIPLLSNLVVKNSEGDYIGTALDIKKSREVKRFRECMDKLDLELNCGNEKESRYIMSRIIPDIVNDIEKMDRKLDLVTVVKIKISARVINEIIAAALLNTYSETELLSYGIFIDGLWRLFKESNLEVDKKWSLSTYTKKIQLSFLRTLAKEYLK